MLVGIDSQSLTYLVEAIEPGYDPATDRALVIATERVAMVRSYLYGDVQFWIMPTVEAEYDRIRCSDKHLRHQRAAWVLLHDAPIHPPGGVIDARADALGRFHSGAADCWIVAEAEFAGLPTLVTFDGDLIDDLTGHTPLALVRPSAFWRSLRIGPGAAVRNMPEPCNPLAHVTWWLV